jgi:hypothetical protein
MKLRLFALLLIALLFAIVPKTVMAQRIGDVIGHALHTDIVAFIGEHPIRSYNIDGRTAVVAEDLADYGFDVLWDADSRFLIVSRLSSLPLGSPQPSYVPEGISPDLIGVRAYSVLYTDIVVSYVVTSALNVTVIGFNIGGRTLVFMDDLAEAFGETYIWCSDSRTLSLGLFMPWSLGVDNPNRDNEQMTQMDGDIAFSIEKCPVSGELAVTDILWENNALNFISLTDSGFRYNIGGFSNMFRWADLSALSEFRVYVNGDLVGGDYTRAQGNANVTYVYRFESRISLTELNTMRVELTPRSQEQESPWAYKFADEF